MTNRSNRAEAEIFVLSIKPSVMVFGDKEYIISGIAALLDRKEREFRERSELPANPTPMLYSCNMCFSTSRESFDAIQHNLGCTFGK